MHHVRSWSKGLPYCFSEFFGPPCSSIVSCDSSKAIKFSFFTLKHMWQFILKADVGTGWLQRPVCQLVPACVLLVSFPQFKWLFNKRFSIFFFISQLTMVKEKTWIHHLRNICVFCKFYIFSQSFLGIFFRYLPISIERQLQW